MDAVELEEEKLRDGLERKLGMRGGTLAVVVGQAGCRERYDMNGNKCLPTGIARKTSTHTCRDGIPDTAFDGRIRDRDYLKQQLLLARVVPLLEHICLESAMTVRIGFWCA